MVYLSKRTIEPPLAGATAKHRPISLAAKREISGGYGDCGWVCFCQYSIALRAAASFGSHENLNRFRALSQSSLRCTVLLGESRRMAAIMPAPLHVGISPAGSGQSLPNISLSW